MSNSTIIAKEMLFTHKFDHGSEPMFIIKDKCFIDCNSSALELLKVKNKTDFLNKHPSEISPEYQPDGVISYIKAEEMIAKSYKNGKHIFPWVHRNSCNENFTVQVTLIDVSIDNEKYLHVTFNIIQEDKISSSNRKFYPFLNKVLNENLKDECKNYTSETMNNYNLLNEHKKAIDVSAIVSKTNTEGVITYVNELFCQTSGYSVKELIGKKHNMVLHPDMPKSIFKDLWATISQGKVWHGIIKNKNKSGGFYYVDTTVNSILDIDGNIKEYIAIRYDITAIYSKDEIINYQNTDQVTQLANHTKLLSDISEKESLYLAIIKIPELENIQSAYITEVHNEALNEIAKYLSSNFPNNYQIYRCSANMFAVTLANNVDFEHFINQCSTVQLDFEQQLIKTQENDFLLSMFIGVANSECTETIYKNALMALMSGKKNNTKLTIYDKDNDIYQNLIQSIEWTKKLKFAIKNNNITIFGQKIIDKNQNFYSTEILMRYQVPDTNQYISPALFLKYAEKANIYNQLSLIMIQKAFLYFAMNSQRFSINVTMRDIEDKKTITTLFTLIQSHDVGKDLTIELVESTHYESNPQLFEYFILKVKSFGCLIAVDDFGSGYSNFDYLLKMPIDIVKIDGSLIQNIISSHKHFIMVKMIFDFCKALDIKVVAEYVKNEEIFNILKSIGIDYYQGYHFHQPELLSAHYDEKITVY